MLYRIILPLFFYHFTLEKFPLSFVQLDRLIAHFFTVGRKNWMELCLNSQTFLSAFILSRGEKRIDFKLNEWMNEWMNRLIKDRMKTKESRTNNGLTTKCYRITQWIKEWTKEEWMKMFLKKTVRMKLNDEKNRNDRLNMNETN